MADASRDHYAIDISRATALLACRPGHSLIETLPKISASLKADPTGWYRSNKLNPAVGADQAPEVRGDGPEKEKAGSHAMAGMQAHAQQMRQMHFDLLWAHGL